ncbi:pentapeptide repeat-containing protein [Limimaricola cinnabarinus]|uniref:pentapeptide repeat-containing protein n=1 Tax=Limimaricola cinnabarinus TaxID=1125964 RepID=UPI002492B4BB|nr:pentapeptide repeat-containing protein [Limimaricola cinnabarinus]
MKDQQQDMLAWLGMRHAPDWQVARALGPLLTVFFALLIAGGYISAFAIVYGVLFGAGAASLATGALIAALMGAPFVIWGTVLKHQTLRYQKEGHITDRITSAVEQLGAEKSVNRIGRPVTIWTGSPNKFLCKKDIIEKYLDEPRSKVVGKEWSKDYDEETDDVWEGFLYSISIWPSERTIIQWQGREIALQDGEVVGHIGSWEVFTETKPNIEVRIGAILSLERIAQDSTLHDKGRDHVRVMEILCAYVRENAPADQAPDFPFPPQCTQDSIEEKLRSTASWISNECTLRADVQLALSVIGRRTSQQVMAERNHCSGNKEGYFIDLSRTNLRYANLEHLNFEGASFFRSQMQGAFCEGASFEGANFVYCQLTGISAANANFANSKLEMADLSHATLTGANLRGCKMSHTHFVRTNLRSSKFCFPGNTDDSEVNRAFFVESDLAGAFIEGDMLGVIFSLRSLQDETIPRAIYGVGFRECRIAGVRRVFGHTHHEASIPTKWLEATFGDASVLLAEDMARPNHWPDWKLSAGASNKFEIEWRKWQANPSNYLPLPFLEN